MAYKLTHRELIYVIVGSLIAWFLTGGKGSVLPIYLLFALLIFSFVWYYQFLRDTK